VVLKFAANLTSKTANEGDPVEFLLDEDVKAGDAVVVAKVLTRSLPYRLPRKPG